MQGQKLNYATLMVEMSREAISEKEVWGSPKQMDGSKAAGSD